jgi:hypothetical protein
MLIASCAWADEGADREAIEQLVATVNSHSKPPSDLFTSDAPDSERTALSVEPMSEVSPVRLTIRSIRFITSEVALVECVSTQYGPVITARITPMLLVMRKDGSQWRIASLRVSVTPTPFPVR